MNSAMDTSMGDLLHTAIINNVPPTHWHRRTLSWFLHLSVDWCPGETRSTKTLISDKSTTDPSSVMSALYGFVWPPNTPHSLFWENASAILVKAQFHLPFLYYFLRHCCPLWDIPSPQEKGQCECHLAGGFWREGPHVAFFQWFIPRSSCHWQWGTKWTT